MSKSAEARRQQVRRDKMFEEVLRENFKKVQSQSIAAGAYAMCKVILKKAQNKDMTDAEKLQDIVDFCMVTVKAGVTGNSEEKKDEV